MDKLYYNPRKDTKSPFLVSDGLLFEEKNVPDDCIRNVLLIWQTLMFLIHI